MFLKEYYFAVLLVFLSASIGEDDIPIVEGVGTFIIPEEDDVLILNEDNFDHVVTTKNLIMVEFYAPWCGHCKTLEPDYAAAAKELKELGIPLAKVDASVEKKIAVRYEVTAYPTLKLFKKEAPPEEFDGTRTTQGIIEFMKIRADPNYTPPPSVVVELDAESFPEFIEEHELSLVEFYAPWCGHCKSLAPEFEAAALHLQSNGIYLAKVDATDNKELAADYKVTGYPTLFLFRKGHQYQYKGPRERVGIVSYMKNQALPPSKEMSLYSVTVQRSPRLAPYIFGSFDNDDLTFFKEYQSAVNEIRDEYICMHTFDDSLGSRMKVEKDSVNVIFPEIYHSKYEAKINSFLKADSTSEDILSWIRAHTTPLVGQRLKNNMDISYKSRPMLVVYYDVDFSHQYVKDTQFIRNKILPVANRHKNITFAISKELDYMDELKSSGLDDSGEDVNVVIYSQNGLRFPMEPDDFSELLLEQFVKNYKIGAIKPFLKSKAIPKTQTGPIKSVVANNFDIELMQNEKDVFIEFYAPWCGHCKKLEPVYKELAVFAQTTYPDVIVAKMDATANDVPTLFSVNGFPSIYFLKGTDKANPITYEGERSLEGFKNFLLEHSTTKMVKEEL